MGQKELQAQLEKANADLDAIKTEQADTNTKIQALKDALANAGTVTPELQAAADALTAKIADVKTSEDTENATATQ